MKKVLALICLILLWSCQEEASITYPETKQQAVVDTYFDTEVVDNYRWLEDDLSEETADWVQNQNDLTFDQLDKIPFRKELKGRLEALWNYEKISAPFQEGVTLHTSIKMKGFKINMFSIAIGKTKKKQVFF